VRKSPAVTTFIVSTVIVTTVFVQSPSSDSALTRKCAIYRSIPTLVV
jgi:hypothetical protein